MKQTYFYISIIFITLTNFVSAQGMTMNNGVFVRMNKGVKLVITNPSPNGLKTTPSGTSSYLISEDETNEIVWSIGNSTGNYVIPYGKIASPSNGIALPFSMNITSAGTPSGSVSNSRFWFSTHPTNDDLNMPRHSLVNNMIGALTGAENSKLVADRFWQLNGKNYTTRPSATLSFTYASDEIVGQNTITESNLQAQRWNDAAGSWEGLLYGSDNASTNVVSGASFNDAGFHEVWTLTDNTSPLPVEFGDISAINSNCQNYINWTTASERSNDYFNVQRSSDLTNWGTIGTVDGAGNSTSEIKYEFLDNTLAKGKVAYYRIQQVDFDGSSENSKVIAVTQDCNKNSTEPLVSPNPFNNSITIISDDVLVSVSLMDAKGKIIRNMNNLSEGKNTFSVENLPTGMYILRTINESNESYIFRLLKN